jgi:molecular chaperone HscB
LESNTRSLQNELTQLLDTDKNYAAAAGAVRKLKFMEKLTSEVHDALEALES